jgi:L-rhamnose-H+ transport protein
MKESELDAEAKRKAVAEFDFRKGMVMAIVAGAFSAGMNFGLQGGEVIEQAAVAAGAKPCWRGMPVLVIVLWGGFVVEAIWCFWQNAKNRTFGNYLHLSPKNLLLAGAVGVLWVSQFVCIKAGEPLMGDMKYISFAVMMASTIVFSTLIGVVTGEWKGTSLKTKASLMLGTLVLVASFCVISIGCR